MFLNFPKCWHWWDQGEPSASSAKLRRHPSVKQQQAILTNRDQLMFAMLFNMLMIIGPNSLAVPVALTWSTFRSQRRSRCFCLATQWHRSTHVGAKPRCDFSWRNPRHLRVERDFKFKYRFVPISVTHSTEIDRGFVQEESLPTSQHQKCVRDSQCFPGGGFDLSRAGPLRRIQNRARSAPVPKNAWAAKTNEKSWLRSDIKSPAIRYQAWIWWSTTFLHDRWDRSRARASRKKKVVRLAVLESSCGRSGFSEVVFLRSFFGLELRMRMLKRHEGCHFSSGVGAWPMGAWTPHGDCARQVNALSRRFPLRRNDQSLREVEQMRQTEVETNYDSGKQTWRSSLAIDEQQWWDLGLNSMWWLRWTSQRIVAAFLFVGETTVAKLERSWENCAKPKWKQTTRQSKTWRRKPCFWRTKSSSLRFDSRSDISSGSVRSDGSAQGADPGRIRFVPKSRNRSDGAAGSGVRFGGSAGSVWPRTVGAVLQRICSLSRSVGADRTGADIWSAIKPLHLICFCFWGQIERFPTVSGGALRACREKFGPRPIFKIFSLGQIA